MKTRIDRRPGHIFTARRLKRAALARTPALLSGFILALPRGRDYVYCEYESRFMPARQERELFQTRELDTFRGRARSKSVVRPRSDQSEKLTRPQVCDY
jgi:hypothetical protein